MKFSVKQLTDITGAEVLKLDIEPTAEFELSTDTRTIKKKNVYLPLIGERFDGHDFIKNAIENGVLGYFTSKNIIEKKAKFVLKVEDTLIAYLKIAHYYKNLVKPKTIAITGSAGKTTTKEMAYYVFKQKFKTHKSEKNHNNEIGLAQTLLSMPKETEVLIVEMGMRGLGEIELLSKYCEPDVAIITNIGSSHIGRLGSYENIAKAKFEITKYLKSNGILIANESKYLDKINNIKSRTLKFSLSSEDLKIAKQETEYSRFKYKGETYRINLSGDYNIQNALAIIEAGLYFGLSPDEIAAGLKKFKPIENRWQVENILGAEIINDAYNANPESMIATVKNFTTLYEGRKILVLGDMGELGKDENVFHKNIGVQLRKMKYDILVTVGNLSRAISDVDTTKSVHYMTPEGCSMYLIHNLRKGDKVLLKASRAVGLEKVVENLKIFEETLR